MLDKNDRRYIIRRIITYISIAFIMVLLNLFCPLFKASALTQPGIISSGQGINITNGNVFQDYRLNNGQQNVEPFKNNGEGNVIFTIVALNAGNAVDQLKQVLIVNDRDQFTCKLGTGTNYVDNTTQRTIYTVDCPVNFSDNYGMKYLRFIRSDNGGILVVSLSAMATFVSKDSPNDYTALIQALDNQTNIIASTINQSNQGTQQAVNDVNNSINNSDSPSNSEISGNSSDWNNYNADNGVINQLVLMPITLLNSFVNGINGTCSSYDFGELWGEHIIFPCIDLSKTLGSVWTIIDVILSGTFIFIFGKRCVKIFNDFTNLRSGQIDTLYGGDN